MDINYEKWFYTTFMLFLACFKVWRCLEQKINLFYTLYVLVSYQAWSTITPTKFGLLVGAWLSHSVWLPKTASSTQHVCLGLESYPRDRDLPCWMPTAKYFKFFAVSRIKFVGLENTPFTPGNEAPRSIYAVMPCAIQIWPLRLWMSFRGHHHGLRGHWNGS